MLAQNSAGEHSKIIRENQNKSIGEAAAMQTPFLVTFFAIISCIFSWFLWGFFEG